MKHWSHGPVKSRAKSFLWYKPKSTAASSDSSLFAAEMTDPPGHTQSGVGALLWSLQYLTSEMGSSGGGGDGAGGVGGSGTCQHEAGPFEPQLSLLNLLVKAGDHVNMCATFVANGVDQPVMS